MPVAYLTDKQIHPSDFMKWRHCFEQFKRGEDRKTVDWHKGQIYRGARVEPIHLGIDDRYRDLYIRDGHHRAVAHMEVGARDFPFNWSWIRSIGGTRPLNESFPYDETKLRALT